MSDLRKKISDFIQALPLPCCEVRLFSLDIIMSGVAQRENIQLTCMNCSVCASIGHNNNLCLSTKSTYDGCYFAQLFGSIAYMLNVLRYVWILGLCNVCECMKRWPFT